MLLGIAAVTDFLVFRLVWALFVEEFNMFCRGFIGELALPRF